MKRGRAISEADVFLALIAGLVKFAAGVLMLLVIKLMGYKVEEFFPIIAVCLFLSVCLFISFLWCMCFAIKGAIQLVLNSELKS